MNKSSLTRILRGIAMATLASTTLARAAVSLTNGSFEITGALYNGALGGLYEPPGWVNLSSNLNFEASSCVAANPPNGEWTAPVGLATGSRALRLAGDYPIYVGAVAQAVGTMQSGHTYYLSADVYGASSVGLQFQCTMALQSDATVTPAVTYATVTEFDIPNGQVRSTALSYTASPGDDGRPLVVLLGTALPGSGQAYNGGVDAVILSDNVPIGPHILQQPVGGSAALGGGFSMSVIAGGPPPYTYQWFKGASPVSGGTDATLNLTGLASGDAGGYTVVVSNANSSVASSAAVLSVAGVSLVNGSFESVDAMLLNAIGGLYQPSGWVNLSTASGGVNFQASSAVAANPPNGEFTCPAGSATGSRVLRMCGDYPVHQGAEAQVVGTMQSGHTYYVTADIYGGPSAGTNYQVIIALANEAAVAPTTVYASCFESGIPSGRIQPTSLSYTATPADQGNPLVVLIKSDIPNNGQAFQGQVDNVQLSDNTPIGPYIKQQPSGATNALGSAAITLRVGAGGSAPMYQWYRGTSPILNATNRTYTTGSPLSLGDAGNYTVVVTAGGHSVTSSVAPIAVLATAVGIAQQPNPLAVMLAGATYTVSVTPSNGASLPITYQWYKDGSPVTDATGNTFSIAAVTSGDAASYAVVVANPVNTVTSTPAVLQLGTLPGNIVGYQTAIRAESSLISEYAFDLGNANDSVGPNNGSLAGATGGALIRNSASLAGGANQVLSLNGRGFANLGTVADFEFAGDRGTVETLVRATWSATNDGRDPWASPAYNPCLFKCGAGGVRWAVYMLQNKSQLVFWNGSAPNLVSIPAPGTSWHHVASVFDGWTGTWTVYWDNAPVFTAFAYGGATGVPTLVGASTPGYPVGGPWGALAQEGWLGEFDEVALYGDALSAAQVGVHYSALHAGDLPGIQTQPQSVVAFPGEPVSLVAGVAGPNLSLQWSKNGTALPGETALTLQLASLTSADAGRYVLQATNNYGSTNTSQALVTVIDPNTSRYLAAVQAEPSLLSLYAFDASDLTDSAGSHNGTAGSGGFDPIVFDPSLGGGNHMVLNGANYVELGLVPAFQFASGVGSVEAMVRADWLPDNLAGDKDFISCRGTLGTVWSVRMIQSKTQMGINNGVSTAWFSIPDPGTNWHHVVVTFNGGQASLHWDGTLLGTVSLAMGTGAGATTQLGNTSPTTLSAPWIGVMDNIALYGSALTTSQVNAHYSSLVGLNPIISRSGSQVAVHWPASTPPGVLRAREQGGSGSWTTVPGITGNSATLNPTNAAQFYRVQLQ